jgi:FKBP-type peptidyl-prolyl cis-trans isomerase
MKALQYLYLMPLMPLLLLAGCSPGEQGPEESTAVSGQAEPPPSREPATAAPVEIEPGLTMRVLNEGSGKTAEPGQTAVVHYTGWLYDAGAPDNRGRKFDSSVDRGQHFEFPLGTGAVIAGWDRGVAGMQIGEVRELTIAPELAYGEQGRPPLIPGNSTLIFEVELADVAGNEGGSD